MSENHKKRKFEWTKKKVIMAIIFIIIVIISVGVFILTLMDETFLFTIIRDYFIVPLLEIGFWAVFVFLFLMVIQSLIAPIPSELILLSGSLIFGFWWGTVLGVIGSMFSAAITYYVSNKGGRAILEATGDKLSIADKMIGLMDEWIESWGIWAIIVGRAVPLIMFDPVSYAAGLSNIKAKQYYIATLIGSIPRAFFFAFLGNQVFGDNRDPDYIQNLPPGRLEEVSGQFNTIFYIIFGVLVLMLALANLLVYIREKKKNNEVSKKIEE
ncbi:TVP38/TMEM64 family protein [Candidatus Lokiarchaeum ossiferum]|uniref:TVP38/TMEM64 family protein n=1 Tax=Candidatus Lokiarchaeum ossiferum TaxID=2951803 RepID=UPI00352F9A66